jgi:hypothetical protein
LSETNCDHPTSCKCSASCLFNNIYFTQMDKKNSQRKTHKKNNAPRMGKVPKFKDPKDEVIYWQTKAINVLQKTTDLQKQLLNELLLEKRKQVKKK